MGHLIGCTCLFDGCRRITTANDGGCPSFGTLGHSLDDRIGALSKGGPFRYSQRAVKDDRPCVCEGLPESSNALRANVQNTPTGFNLVAGNDPRVRLGFKAISDDHIHGEEQFQFTLTRFRHEIAGSINLALLKERSADFVALRLEESIRHTSTNQELIHHADQSLYHHD